MIGKSFLKIFSFLALAFAGGAFAGQVWPGSAATGDPASQAPVYITQKPQITVQENKALKEAVGKVVGAVVGISSNNSKGIVSYGSGIILTSDGLVAAPYGFFAPGMAVKLTVAGKEVAYELVKRDKEQNLAILKLENSNWPTAGFYQLDDLKLGERVFIIGSLAQGGSFTNEGIVRDFDPDAINTNIIEKAEAAGSPAFDIEGNILGISVVDKAGWVSLVPISQIKAFSGL